MEINMEQPTQPSLNISDLQMVIELIDLCSQRGAFRGEELTTVGMLYSRIREFLNTVQPEVDESTATETEVSTND